MRKVGRSITQMALPDKERRNASKVHSKYFCACSKNSTPISRVRNNAPQEVSQFCSNKALNG